MTYWIQDYLPGMEFLADYDYCPWCPEMQIPPETDAACRCKQEFYARESCD